MFNSNFIKKIKKFFFPFYKDNDLKFVFKKLQEDFTNQSKTAMFVGGCVRKHLLNEEIDDIDIATTLTTDQVKKKFEDSKFHIIESGIKHGTITLVSKKLKLELTTLRKDIKTDGRHAEIEYTDNWQQDSERRDFTINAIYLDINGKIFDPQLGITDLKNHNIKFIGDPQKRIEEDYLRIIRFIRFSLEYESKVEPTTIEAIKLNLDGIKKISKERILSELFKILNTKNFLKLNNNKELKEIFSLIFAEFRYLERLNKLENINDHLNFDKKTFLAVMLIDEKNNHEYFSHKYNVSNELKDALSLVAKNFTIIQNNKEFFLKDLKKNIYFFGKMHLATLNALHFTSNKKMKLKDYLDVLHNIKKIDIPKFSFDGNYLKEKGMKEGALIGKALKRIENEWLDNNFKISDKRVLKIIKEQNH
ncbi:CCA tRNA nucleotidyltransferase [Pelagibacterales bacterium SAG-MED05]|nr:CCA tRNA nucleotidyltransferase [Pelagibacterales bacterium SAG-MED05]